MPARDRLSAIGLKKAKPGKHYDGGGLFLRVDKSGTGRWIYRFRVNGQQREMGLGSQNSISLQNVRLERNRWAAVVAAGRDPIRQREREKAEQSIERPTLADVTSLCFEAKKATLKDGGNAGRWASPLDLHVMPRLGKTQVDEVTQNDIHDSLKSIWRTKPETPKKAINRLGIVLKHGAAMGLDVDLQATMKAKELLGEQDHRVQHIPAMPWSDVPAFYASLEDGGMVSECLRFIILTVGPRFGTRVY